MRSCLFSQAQLKAWYSRGTCCFYPSIRVDSTLRSSGIWAEAEPIMAAGERIPQNVSQPSFVSSILIGELMVLTTRSLKGRQCQDDEVLDIDLLCRKLEAAKREREEREAASRLRKQVRENVRNNSGSSREDDRPRLWKTSSEDNASKRRSWYKPFGQSCQQQSFSTTNINIPEHEPIRCEDLISPVLAEEDRDTTLLSRCSTPDEEISQERQQTKAKRSSFTVLRRFASNDREKVQRIKDADNDRPESKRSQTVPQFKSKYFSPNAHLEHSRPQDSCRPSDEDESIGGFINEYCISFDTCHVKETMRHQAVSVKRPKQPPQDRPRLGQNEGMRSFLTLPSAFKRDKKDRAQARVEEIRPADIDEEDDPAFRRPHTRSQTAPEELLCGAVDRLKREEKAKKRRSMGGMLSSLLLPNHGTHAHEIVI